MIHQARAIVRAGYALVVCKPGSKVPMCTLNSNEMNQADKAAREAAQTTGRRNWEKVTHDCGLKHAITDEKTSDRVLKRLIKERGRVNLGIELGQSRVVVVDVDSTTEDAAFQQAWHQATGAPIPFGMSISSPGVYAEETWKHKDGGHYWFRLPEGFVLPTMDGALKMPGGWSVMWADRQVLVPPSVRPEGAYTLVGDQHEIPEWLIKTILKHMIERKERAERRVALTRANAVSGDGSAIVDLWSSTVPWSALLEADNDELRWYDTGKLSNCGCGEWTAPGPHGSSKSATAHEAGCAEYDATVGHCPIHVWTDNPPLFLTGPKAQEFSSSGKTFTKIQYLALRDHEGDIRRACAALNISTPKTVLKPLAAQNMISAIESIGETPDPSVTVSATSGQDLATSGNLTPLTMPVTATTTPVTSDLGIDPVHQLELRIQERYEFKHVDWLADQRIRADRFPFAVKTAAEGFTRASDIYDEVMSSQRAFLISGWLPERTDIALGAEYKAGKTFISMDAAVSLASATAFLNTFEVPAARSVAIMIGEANNKDYFQKLTAICESRSLDTRDVLRRLHVKFGSWKLDDPALVERLYRSCGDIEDLGLIVIDPWYLAAGAADGKTLSVMGDVLSNLTGLRNDLDTSLMITTHWNQTGQGKGFNRWTGNGLQEWGRTLINVALDAPVEGPKPYSVDPTGLTTARLSIVLKGETAGSYLATRAVSRKDARDLDTEITYRVIAEESMYDAETEPTPEEKKLTTAQMKLDSLLEKILRYIKAKGAEGPTVRHLTKDASLGKGGGGQALRLSAIEKAVEEELVENMGSADKMKPSGAIVDGKLDPDAGAARLVVSRQGYLWLEERDRRRAMIGKFVPLTGTLE